MRYVGCGSKGGAAEYQFTYRATLIKTKQLCAGLLAASLGWAAGAPARVREKPRSNWTSADAPCAKYDDLRNRFLGDIGVKIDVAEPWADGFRRALRFWSTVLAANFHEVTDLNACDVRIINGDPSILNHAVIARSQIPGWGNFNGKIAVSAGAAKELNSSEIYGTAVHELGHILGLSHNADSRSVMYPLNVDGTEGLDSKDIMDLSRWHELRPAISSKLSGQSR